MDAIVFTTAVFLAEEVLWCGFVRLLVRGSQEDGLLLKPQQALVASGMGRQQKWLYSAIQY
jgi:hypothetical protein